MKNRNERQLSVITMILACATLCGQIVLHNKHRVEKQQQ